MDQRLLHFLYDRSVQVTTISTWRHPRCPQRPHIGAMQHLDLSDDETAGRVKELHAIIDSDRYPLSPHIRTLTAIVAKLRPEPVREPLPGQQRTVIAHLL
jgi:hypothetical protein